MGWRDVLVILFLLIIRRKLNNLTRFKNIFVARNIAVLVQRIRSILMVSHNREVTLLMVSYEKRKATAVIVHRPSPSSLAMSNIVLAWATTRIKVEAQNDSWTNGYRVWMPRMLGFIYTAVDISTKWFSDFRVNAKCLIQIQSFRKFCSCYDVRLVHWGGAVVPFVYVY